MPFILVSVFDALTVGLLLAASYQALRHLLSEGGRSATPPGRIWGRLAALAVLGGALLFTWLVGVHLIGTVPGAHCGSGVLEAMGSPGERALWLRALAVLAALAWWDVHRSERTGELGARLTLVWAPIVVVAGKFELHALHGLGAAPGHHACGVGATFAGSTAPVAIEHVAAFGAALLLGAAWTWWRPPRRWPLPLVLAALAPLFAVLSMELLASSPRHLGGWSLLLPAYHRLGFPLYAALFATTVAGLAPLWTWWLAPRLQLPWNRVAARHRLAAGSLCASVLVSAGLWAVLSSAQW